MSRRVVAWSRSSIGRRRSRENSFGAVSIGAVKPAVSVKPRSMSEKARGSKTAGKPRMAAVGHSASFHGSSPPSIRPTSPSPSPSPTSYSPKFLPMETPAPSSTKGLVAMSVGHKLGKKLSAVAKHFSGPLSSSLDENSPQSTRSSPSLSSSASFSSAAKPPKPPNSNIKRSASLIETTESSPTRPTRSASMLTMKVLLVGDASIGKTSLVKAYNGIPVSPGGEYTPTVFDTCQVASLVDEIPVYLSVWDTSGDPANEMRPLSYPGTDVFVLCFSLASKESFKNAKSLWYPEILQHLEIAQGSLNPIILVGISHATKAPVVSAAQLAREIRAQRYLQCSVWPPRNLNTLFCECARVILNTATRHPFYNPPWEVGALMAAQRESMDPLALIGAGNEPGRPGVYLPTLSASFSQIEAPNSGVARVLQMNKISPARKGMLLLQKLTHLRKKEPPKPAPASAHTIIHPFMLEAQRNKENMPPPRPELEGRHSAEFVRRPVEPSARTRWRRSVSAEAALLHPQPPTCQTTFSTSTTSSVSSSSTSATKLSPEPGRKSPNSPGTRGSIWLHLPDSIWLRVLSRLTPYELCQLALTCKDLHRIANNSQVWKELCDIAWHSHVFFRRPEAVHCWKTFFQQCSIKEFERTLNYVPPNSRRYLPEGMSSSPNLPSASAPSGSSNPSPKPHLKRAGSVDAKAIQLHRAMMQQPVARRRTNSASSDSPLRPDPSISSLG